MINDQIEVTVLAVEGDTIKIGIHAPRTVEIYRKEIYEAIQESNQGAVIHVSEINNLMGNISNGISNSKRT